MRMLFEIDKKDYDQCTRTFVRNSARSIIIRDGRVAMIHSLKYDYYKFPGGGIEKDESPVDAVIRETREEAGLVVIPESVKEFGCVHRIEKSTVSDPEECFIQDNLYYLCGVTEEQVPQQLDDYEAEESFEMEFVDPSAAILGNRRLMETSYPKKTMLDREARILEILISERYLK